MLPLWRDQLRIGLSPDAVVLTRIGKGFRPHVSEKHIEPCQPSAQDAWHGTLDTLTRLLTQEKWQNANAVVTLSNHFVRYLLIPWNAEINGEQEQTAYVKHRFSKVFGSAANHWALRQNSETTGMPILASGIDQALLDGIRQTCQKSKLQLRSVQPYLMPSFNQYRHLFKNSADWFVIAEHGKLIIVMFQNQSWQHVSTHLIDNENLAETLPLLLDRQLRLSSLENQPGKVFLLAPENPRLSFPRNSKWPIQQLQTEMRFGLSLQEARQYALVMGEV